MQTTATAPAPAVPAKPAEQPFSYPLNRAFVEPDWTRIPGYKDVSKADWESALWQRRHTIKNLNVSVENTHAFVLGGDQDEMYDFYANLLAFRVSDVVRFGIDASEKTRYVTYATWGAAVGGRLGPNQSVWFTTSRD